MPTAHEDVDHLAHFLVAACHRVQFALAGAFGQVNGIALQGVLLTRAEWRCRTAGFTWRSLESRTVSCLEPGFRRQWEQLGECVAQRWLGDLFELLRN